MSFKIIPIRASYYFALFGIWYCKYKYQWMLSIKFF
jgi:hypothetical protein